MRFERGSYNPGYETLCVLRRENTAGHVAGQVALSVGLAHDLAGHRPSARSPQSSLHPAALAGYPPLMKGITVNIAPLDAVGIAHRYIALWNETDAARRHRLLAADWTADARYVDPLTSAIGAEQIDALVNAVQQRYPGFRFHLKGHADAHGEHLRFSWTLGPSGAEDLIEGTDFAEVENGKLRSVTGFLDKVPSA